jgi:aryl-alcohol dehydrogenase-like predicted oxidoreductase
VLGLGLAALGRPGYVNLGHARDLERDYAPDVMERGCHAVLDAAWDAGVRYVDTARSYGRAEEFLATWLAARAIDPAAITVASKWGYTYTAGWRVDAPAHEIKDHSLATFTRQRAETVALLGDHLDRYQIHSATLASGVLDDAAVLDALARLRDEGTSVGLTTSGTDQADVVRRALAVERSGQRVFSSVQTTWNLLEPSAGRALADAHAAGSDVIVKEALANGRLTDRGTDDEITALRVAAAARGVTIDALALACALAQPWCTVVLSGASTAAQLQSNAGATAIDIGADLLAELAPMTQEPDRYWSVRHALPWN